MSLCPKASGDNRFNLEPTARHGLAWYAVDIAGRIAGVVVVVITGRGLDRMLVIFIVIVRTGRSMVVCERNLAMRGCSGARSKSGVHGWLRDAKHQKQCCKRKPQVSPEAD